MRADVKEKWVAALRSGEYRQGQGSLRASHQFGVGPDRFCCLGVLCNLAAKEGAGIYLRPPASGSTSWSYDGERSYLPNSVARWADMEERGDGIPEDQYALASMNDAGKSFEDIADYIEEHL